MRHRLFVLLLVSFVFLQPSAISAGGLGTQEQLEAAMKEYYHGDMEKARELLRPLAESGCVKAQSTLSGTYDRSPANGGDPEKALKWIRIAAKRGSAQAQYLLGSAYEDGAWGLPSRAFEEARRWYERAAEQGEPRAMEQLGYFYARGSDRGVEHDLVEAYKWYTLAIPRFAPPTEKRAYGVLWDNRSRARVRNVRQAITRSMSSEQVKRAERLAESWEEEHDQIHHMPKTSNKPLPLWHQRISGGCDET